MEPSRSRIRLNDLALASGIFLGTVTLRIFFQYHPFDDAFITFRYSLNLLEGRGFVYNEGERVLATSTPLFAVLLAGLGFLFRTHDFLLLSNIVNQMADGATAVVLYLVGLRLWRKRLLAVLLALLFACSFHMVLYSGTGMETSFYTFLTAFSLERALRRRYRTAFVLAALALLTRPDGLLLWVALALQMALFDRRRFRAADLAPAALILLAAAAMLKLYFGTILPHSMVAKHALQSVGEDMFSFGLPNAREVVMFWSGFLTKSHSEYPMVNLLQLLPFLALAGAGMHELARRSRRIMLLPAFCLLFSLAYAKAGGFLYPWYLVPTVPYLILMLFAGSVALGRMLARRARAPQYSGAVACATVLLFSQAVVFAAPRDTIPSAIARTMYPAHTRRAYLAALSRVPGGSPGQTIMAPEIGFIGFERPRARLIDPMGIVSPEVVEHFLRRGSPPSNMQFLTSDLVEAFRPDFIITLQAFKGDGFDQSPFILRDYEKIPVPFAPLDDLEAVSFYRKRATGRDR